MLFWGNNRTQTTRPTTSSSSGVSSLFVSQSRSVWNEYIESSRTSYVYATKRNVKSFRPGLSILIIKDFLIIGGVHGTDWQNVCAECGQGDVAIQNNMTWNMPAIVVFSGCSDNDEFFITLYNIYAYYDRIIQCSMQLRVTFPQSVLVWANPKDHLDGRFNNGSVNNNADLRKLHAHLVLEHLINRRGLLVMPPPTGDLTTPSEARTWLANVQNQVDDITQRISKELIRSVDGGSTANTNTSFNMLAEYQRDASKIAQQEIRSLHAVCAKYTTTRRYHPLCHPADALAFPLLITGLGGAGTHFVAQRLRSVGWRVLHEDIDVDGSVVIYTILYHAFSCIV